MSFRTVRRIAMLVSLLALAGCRHVQQIDGPYQASEAASSNSRILSIPELRTVRAIMNSSDAGDRSRLMVARLKGVLIVYLGDPAYRNGVLPAGSHSCPAGCREGYAILGSHNLIFFPETNGGFHGSRISAVSSNYYNALDAVAEREYKRNHLRTPASLFRAL